jgi:hypothetical protein
VRSRIEEWNDDRDLLVATLAKEEFRLPANAGLLPICGHRCVVCEQDTDRSVVLSIVDHDVIVFATSLEEYLVGKLLDGNRIA